MASEGVKSLKQNEKIFAEFQTLRNEQRSIANNLSALEMDLKEHKTVIETLRTVDEGRRCFRLIGGVLCERKVKDVLPQLIENNEFLQKTTAVVADQLEKKGVEINNFKEKNNIRIRGQTQEQSTPNKTENESEKTDSQTSRTALVV